MLMSPRTPCNGYLSRPTTNRLQGKRRKRVCLCVNCRSKLVQGEPALPLFPAREPTDISNLNDSPRIRLKAPDIYVRVCGIYRKTYSATIPHPRSELVALQLAFRKLPKKADITRQIVEQEEIPPRICFHFFRQKLAFANNMAIAVFSFFIYLPQYFMLNINEELINRISEKLLIVFLMT